MTFTFSDPRGWQDLSVLNILINSVLDGRGACYLAYSVASKSLSLVGDSSAQCSVSNTGVSVDAAGTTLTLTVPLVFTASFGGNKVVYLAARDSAGANSGWHAFGTWTVPFTRPSAPSVVGVTASGYTFAGVNSYKDISVVDILINSALDARHACYFAFDAVAQNLVLMDDAGATPSPASPVGYGFPTNPANSQCTLYNASWKLLDDRTLALAVSLNFNPTFAGNQVIYAAARGPSGSSGWQPIGILTVP